MTTLNLTVPSSAEDDSGSTAFGLLNSTVLYSGKISGAFSVRAYFRFTNVTITQGSTINSALFRPVAVDTDTSTNWITRLYFNAVDNASNPASGAALDALALTTAFATPTNSLNTSAGTRYDFDVTSVLQEIVNRAGWASGNAVTVLWLDNGSTNGISRRWNDYSGGAANAAKLDIDYTAGSPAAPRRKLMLMGVG